MEARWYPAFFGAPIMHESTSFVAEWG